MTYLGHLGHYTLRMGHWDTHIGHSPWDTRDTKNHVWDTGNAHMGHSKQSILKPRLGASVLVQGGDTALRL